MIKYQTIETTKIAIVEDENIIISDTQDAVDILGETYYENCSRIIINAKNLHTDFFRLPTGLAGDILQKFSNYQCKLAVVGDFTKYTSKSFQDFIRESNKGNRIYFVDSIDSAIMKMSV